MPPERTEWTTVFERFPAGRVPIVGSIAILVHDWSKPADGHPRLFERDALEIVTTAHPTIVGSVYTAITLTLIAFSLWHGFSGLQIAGRFAIGAFVWSLTEYLMHRYAFHFVPRSPLGVAMAYLSHGVHHAFPRDPHRLVMPLVVSLPISAVIGVVGFGAFGLACSPFLAGFAAGYLSYDLIHYHLHQYEGDPHAGRIVTWLRRYHFQHHFAVPDRQFGVSTPFWDYVFRTGR
jgi:sterol desaturase/sphingolipid hydroxylase (fatty acid hydroxylase superfamily)